MPGSADFVNADNANGRMILKVEIVGVLLIRICGLKLWCSRRPPCRRMCRGEPLRLRIGQLVTDFEVEQGRGSKKKLPFTKLNVPILNGTPGVTPPLHEGHDGVNWTWFRAFTPAPVITSKKSRLGTAGAWFSKPNPKPIPVLSGG
jgi:hypothetical protein